MPDPVYCLLRSCSLPFQFFPLAFDLVKVVHAAAAMVVVLAMATVDVLVDGVVARVVRM